MLLPLNDIVIDYEAPNELGNNLTNLEFSYLIGNHFKGNMPLTLMNSLNLEVVDTGQQFQYDDCGKYFVLN